MGLGLAVVCNGLAIIVLALTVGALFRRVRVLEAEVKGEVNDRLRRVESTQLYVEQRGRLAGQQGGRQPPSGTR